MEWNVFGIATEDVEGWSERLMPICKKCRNCSASGVALTSDFVLGNAVQASWISLDVGESWGVWN
jgi:hypothetical protein